MILDRLECLRSCLLLICNTITLKWIYVMIFGQTHIVFLIEIFVFLLSANYWKRVQNERISELLNEFP